MAERRIVWTQTAARQRRLILEYWYRRNSSADYSLKLIKISEARLVYIRRHPFSFPESSYAKTRRCLLGHFSIFYQVRDESIIVTAFWDNRQNPRKLIKLLTK